MRNNDGRWIVRGASSQVQIVTYGASIRLACLGIGDAVYTDLTVSEVTRIEVIAAELHRLSRWASPPDPRVLAAHASVSLTAIPLDSRAVDGFWPSRAVYRSRQDADEEGLAAAFALAGSLVLQRDLTWSPIYRWRLAAELLTPAWALSQYGAERFTAQRPHAPAWLIEHRDTQRIDDAATK